jgi:hypothetical protein
MGEGQGQGMGEGQGMGQGQGQPMQPTMGATSASATVGGVSKGGSTPNNQKTPDGELELKPAAQGDSRGDAVNQDSDATAAKFEKEPWFAKLPPNLRKAIEAKARREAPRGYEERLRRYFESTD